MTTLHEAAPLDVGALLDHGAWGGFQKLVLGFAALAFAADGMANQVLGLALPALSAAWGLPKHDFAPVAALGLIGVAIGTMAGGLIGDRYGRRPALIASMVLFGVMTAIIVTSTGVATLALWRSLAGLGLGAAIPNGAALVAEYTPVRRRSLGVTIAMLFIPIGGVLVGLAGSWLLPEFGWKSLFLLTGSLPIVAALVFMAFLPESPRFLSRFAGRRVELRALLARLGHGASTSPLPAEHPVADAPRQSFATLLRRDVVVTTLALWAGFFLCFIANYSMLSWGPSLLTSTGFSIAAASAALSTYNFGGILGGLATGAAMGRYGYRPTLLLVSAVSAVGAALLAAALHSLTGAVLLSVCLGVEGIFIGGVQNGLYALASHIYPSRIKATGVGAASSIGRLGAVASSFTGVMSIEAGGSAGFFGGIAFAMVLMFIAAALLRHETEVV